MERIGIYVDATSIWYHARVFGEQNGKNGARLDYMALRTSIARGKNPICTHVYLSRPDQQDEKFHRFLQHAGFEIKKIPMPSNFEAISLAISDDIRRDVEEGRIDKAVLVASAGSYEQLVDDIAWHCELEIRNFNVPSRLDGLEGTFLRRVPLDESVLQLIPPKRMGA